MNNVSEQTFYRWGKKYGNFGASRYGSDLKCWKRKHRAEEAAHRSNTQESGEGGNVVKKMVRPKQKKRVVKDAAGERACAYLSLSW